jgi:hypothetical protein
VGTTEAEIALREVLIGIVRPDELGATPANDNLPRNRRAQPQLMS